MKEHRDSKLDDILADFKKMVGHDASTAIPYLKKELKSLFLSVVGEDEDRIAQLRATKQGGLE